jgi:pimeloyl-ACP methyl ester carboxylesterase
MMNIRVGILAVDKMAAEYKKYNYPLLFVHGAGGNTVYLKNYMDFFSKAGWDCYAVNLRGHGASDPIRRLETATIEDYVEDVNKVRTTLGIENCALIGHSMGGLISQKTAEGSDKIKALVLIASAPPKGVKFEFQKNFTLVKIILRGIWSGIRRKAIKPSYAIADKTVLNNLKGAQKMEIFNILQPESLAVSGQVGKGYPIDVDKIHCPKLVIGCKKDMVALESMEEKLAAFIKADKYIAYEQFGHMIMVEKGWEKSAEDIRDWLSSKVKNWD